MTLIFIKEIGIAQFMDILMEDDFWMTLELLMFASNVIKEVCVVLDVFFSFRRNYMKKKIP